MSQARKCPVCGGASRAGGDWDSFWSGTTVCRECGTPLRLRTGWKRHVIHNGLMWAAAAAAFLATRGLPGLWAVGAFLALFVPAATGLVALVQWFRWRYVEMTPLVDQEAHAGPQAR